jgi:cell division protein FtsN
MLLVGLFGGYVLGILSAFAIWMYISKGPSPFISPDKPDNAVAKSSGPDAQKGAQALSAADKTKGADGKGADGKPRFEFYNILPNTEEPITDQQLKQTAQQPAPKDKYFLQAGSFQNAGDADNLKAKLAMLGVEATVQDVNLPEKGVMHRVRVGPFGSVDEMKQVRVSLQQNGVQSSLIKIHEGVQ